MAKSFKLGSAALAAGMILSLEGAEIKLPAPQRTGGLPLQEVLNRRQTVRKYQDKVLDDATLSTLMCSANGVNRPDGRRTAPSARNAREIEIYVLTADGACSYDPEAHALKALTATDLRSKAGSFNAPVYLLLVADAGRAPGMDYARIDAGYVSQNIYMYCASAGLGTCAIGSITRPGNPAAAELRTALGFGEDKVIILSHSVGYPADR